MTEAFEQKLFIEGPLPGMNEIIELAKKSGNRRGAKCWNGYAEMKKTWGEIVKLTALAQKIKPVSARVWIDYVWYEPNRKRDPDNVCAGGRKLILDGLVHAGVLQGDGWKHISGHSDVFTCVRMGHGRPGVMIVIREGKEDAPINKEDTLL